MTEWICEPLSDGHDIDQFNCGETDLDEWLRSEAMRKATQDLSRTYVCHNGDDLVLAYFTLVPHVIERTELPSAKARRNMPSQIPAVLLGKLAVQRGLQGQGYGRDALIAALERAVAVADQAGGRYVVVDALNERVAGFYERHDFVRIPSVTSLRLALLVADVRESLNQR